MPNNHGYKITQGEDGNWNIYDENNNLVDGPYVTWDHANREAHRLPPRARPNPLVPDKAKDPTKPARPASNDGGPGR
ncbi:hypothetical protein [Pseudomonas sp. CFBP 8772]|uniref:hypothetical protein n=1 Tax=Pseudomonas sp. CFBP 8772 TaxID=2775284 RepID=UPI00177FC494|nr:hypothetical protein [Pseudomonas sp. CFBP 8772]MBD8598760.1 hypothetical protein [Pseudomonas sp. CFBP 8772]